MHQERNTRSRERVERGIYKRTTADGQTKYDISYTDSDGRHRWKTADRLQEARTIRADMVSKVARGERVAPAKTTVAEYVETWLEKQEPRLRPKTYEGYRNSLQLHVIPRLGHRRVQAVTVDDIAALAGSMAKGVRYVKKDDQLVKVEGKPYAAWTIRGTLVALGRLLGSATRDGLIPANPVRRLETGERPKTTRRDFPSLDIATIGKLIAATPDRYRTLVAVSVLTGIRQGEALGLTWQDIDTKAGVIRVSRQLDRHYQLVEPKTPAAKREIPIPPSLGKMITAHKAKAFELGRAKPGDFVFVTAEGGPMHHRTIVRRGLEKAIKATGVAHLSWHDLRHLAASVLISQGASVSYVSRVLGHSSPAITLGTYAHEFAKAEHADATRERMEAAFGGVL